MSETKRFTFEKVEIIRTGWAKIAHSLLGKPPSDKIHVNIFKDGKQISWVKGWSYKQVNYLVDMLNRHCKED